MRYATLFLIFVQTALLAQKPVFTNARTTAATVYFNSAEITQTASAALPKGSCEIVVKNVADFLNENTVRIGMPASVTVLSVQFTKNYISEYEPNENDPDIKKVRDSIDFVTREIARLGNAKDSELMTIQMLDKNQVVSGTATGLQLAELMKLVEYYKQKRTELSNSHDALEKRIADNKLQLTRLNARLQTNLDTSDKTSSGKLIIQVMNETAGTVPFTLNYITQNAFWTPFYDMRADGLTAPINMTYKAQVTQSTGIDWKQVKLTLSSGNPTQNNMAPQLQSWFLRYNSFRSGDKDLDRSTSYINALQGKAPGLELNDVEVQSLGYKSALNQKTSVIEAVAVENQLNISFDIEIPYDILSNGKAHSVALNETKLPATYRYYAAPRAEAAAFLLAEIKDYSQYNLLPGNANIIFDGMHVGRTFINPNQTTDTLKLSMGRDKKVMIKREKIADKSGIKFLSSKKEQTFTYDITVRNNKKDAIDMLLKDQYPLSTDKEVEIVLTESSGAQVGQDTGILTWNLRLKPNETKVIRISYRVKYPKDRIFDNL